MAYLEIPSDDINVGKPVKKSLFQKIRDNFIDHESRISALSAGANKISVIDHYFDPSFLEIGKIIASDLTEAQFNAINGGGWLLCNNQSAVGTLYHTITGYTTTPDLRDQFLRGASGTVALRTAYADSTAVNGLSASTSTSTTTTTGTSLTSDGAHTHIQQQTRTTTGDIHTHVTEQFFSSSIEGVYTDDGVHTTQGVATVSTQSSGTHSHTATSTSSSSSTSTTSLLGDAETRPQNMGVNFFIQVDISITTKAVRIKAREDMTIVNAKGYVMLPPNGSLPTSGTFEFDIKKGATIAALTSVYSVKPTLAYGGTGDGAETSSGTVISGGFDVTAGDWIQVDITSLMKGQGGYYVQVFAEPA